jgi:hypothetical protein
VPSVGDDDLPISALASPRTGSTTSRTSSACPPL